MKNILMNTFLVLASLYSLIGCGTKVGTGAVNVQFTNSTASAIVQEMEEVGVRGFVEDFDLRSGLLGVTPTIYQMKLVVFYLVENLAANGADNAGNVARIWTSNRCDADLTLCGIDTAHSGTYVVDYFDFAQGTSAVNAAFQSYKRDTQESQISAGTYRYLRMDFTGRAYDGDTAPNLKFGTTTGHEVRAQNQSLLVTLPEQLVLAEGETFTVNLAYDLQKRFYASGTYAQPPAEVSSSQKWTCKGTGSGIPCIVEAEFSPTVTKN